MRFFIDVLVARRLPSVVSGSTRHRGEKVCARLACVSRKTVFLPPSAATNPRYAEQPRVKNDKSAATRKNVYQGAGYLMICIRLLALSRSVAGVLWTSPEAPRRAAAATGRGAMTLSIT